MLPSQLSVFETRQYLNISGWATFSKIVVYTLLREKQSESYFLLNFTFWLGDELNLTILVPHTIGPQ
jgi:hypothetical protein